MQIHCSLISFGLQQPLGSVRFVAVSATIPNIRDIAQWLLVPPPGVKQFGEEVRPCKLKTVVRWVPFAVKRLLVKQPLVSSDPFRSFTLPSIPCVMDRAYKAYKNDFLFEKALTGYLPGIIAEFSSRKPTLVFCRQAGS